MPTTPNMGLQKPTVGGSGDAWGGFLNSNFDDIDAHGHTTGDGVPIVSAALRINADVPWAYGGVNRAITALRAVDFTPATAASVSTYAAALFANADDGNNLTFRTQAGSNIRITNGTTLDLTVTGGIVGDYAVVGAECAFSDSNDAYTFKQQGSPKPWARIRCGDLDLYEVGVTSNRVRLKSPAALASGYVLEFPGATPAGKRLVQTSSAGVLTFENTGVQPLTMDADASVTVSGNGDFKHGTRTFCQSAGFGVCPSGTFASAAVANVVTSALSAAGVVYLQIGRLRTGDRLISIALTASSVAAPTVAIYVQTAGVSAVKAHTADGNTIPANGYTTLTLNTPYTLTYSNPSGDHVWLKVTAGAATLDISQLTITYDRP